MLHLLSMMHALPAPHKCRSTRVTRLTAPVCFLLALAPVTLLAENGTWAPYPTAGQIDRIHASMALSVNEAARWFDSFFEDERHITEEASSRIRLRPSVLLEDGKAADLKFSIGARINVPRFNQKLKLVISDVDNDESDSFNSRRFTDPESDETNIGLQYTLRDKDRLNTHLALGIKTGGNHGVDLFFGPRVRKTWRFEPWQLRFTERVRWYTDIGWESRTRLDLDRIISTNWLLRGTFDVRIRENDYHAEGLRYNITPSLIQKLRHHAAIEYQWSTSLVTRPNHRVDETGLRLRFRQQVWRKWPRIFCRSGPRR